MLPAKSHADLRADGIVGERDHLAQAVAAVADTPWPKPQSVSLISRITGAGGGERITFSDAVAAYVDAIYASEKRSFMLISDAQSNLADAAMLNDAAMAAVDAPRLSMNDVRLLEGAIQTLRENRRVYEAAAEKLEQRGAAVDPMVLEGISDRYSLAIRTLGEAADQLAERIENDRSRTFALPERSQVDNLTGI